MEKELKYDNLIQRRVKNNKKEGKENEEEKTKTEWQ